MGSFGAQVTTLAEMAKLQMPPRSVLDAADQMRAEAQNKAQNGRAMKKLGLARRAMVQAFAATKEIQPATIINFNPFDVKLDSGLNYSVPAYSKQVEDMLVKVKYGRNTFVGAYLTIREPFYYYPITDVKLETGADPADGSAEYTCAACRPIESAWHLWASVNGIAKDATNIGGVIILEGDHHKFRKAVLAASENPESDAAKIRVPRFMTLENQDRQYYLEDVAVIDVLADAFGKQMNAFESVLQIAQANFDDPEQRKNITSFDRKFAQYGMTMGWRQTAPSWLNAVEDPKDACTGCGTMRTRSDAHFCTSCNRPYDAHAAFMAGENVPEAFLAALPEEKLKDIRKEMRRRKDALDLSKHEDEDDDPTPLTPAPTPKASPAQPPVSTPQQPAPNQDKDGHTEKLENKPRGELLELARSLGLDLHHNTGVEKIVHEIRAKRAADMRADDEDDDLTSM